MSGRRVVPHNARMQILLSALGSAGDVHPFIAIGRVLVAQGHRVRVLAAPVFADRVQRARLDFAPMGEPGEYERLLAQADLWDARRGARFILDELLARLPEAYATTAAHVVTGETLLVGSTLAWGTRLVQEKTGIPAATVHLSPLCLPSAIAPPVLPVVGDLAWLPTPMRRWSQALAERLVMDRWTRPRLNAFRETLGLPPVRHVWSRWIHSPDLVIGAWPEWFAPTQADWPPATITSGFPIFDEGGAGMDDALRAFLEAGPPPVGITPGSAMAHGRQFFARALAACTALSRRAIFITPFADQLPATLPASFHHVAYAPFGALLPRLSALVHHGGIGTAAQALTTGVMQVVVPFAHDQFDNAARLRRLGVSCTLAGDASVDAWCEALRSDPARESAVRRAANTLAREEPAAERIAGELVRLGERRGLGGAGRQVRPTGRQTKQPPTVARRAGAQAPR